MVDEEKFIQKLYDSLSNNFEVYLDVKVNDFYCDLFGKFQDTKVRTFITSKDVIDQYTNYEYFVVKRFQEQSLSHLIEYVNQVVSLHENYTKPDEYHMSTVTNCVLLIPLVDDSVEKFIKRFKYKKVYKFYLHGWSEIRLCAVDQSTGRIFKSRNAGILKNFLEKLISKTQEVLR
ncbi:hypothetical protein [Pseudothermotoga thermarum]|uniref:DUF8052 domain-containing protein n=1 Tax=Pseudothermotoga thermarum DSM 5069 TaxID=688269 RepID=F7YU04_9THEM|nr:hypothetical protein [Pseudothermotoga thermarum]AEH51586.1 hypothetical protein Theth_1533 [Pseudothermotoga thermarum DSM 5069]